MLHIYIYIYIYIYDISRLRVKDHDLLGHSMAVTVSCRAFTAEFRIQTQPSPFGTCVEHKDTRNLLEDFGFPLVTINSRMLHTHWSTHYRHFVTSATESLNNTLKSYALEYDTAYFGRRRTFIAVRTSEVHKSDSFHAQKRRIQKYVRMFFRHFWPVLIITSDAFSHSKYIALIVWWLVNHVWENVNP